MPAVAETGITERRVSVKEGLSGVGPLPRKEGRPSAGNTVANPFSTTKGLLSNSRDALLSPLLRALSLIAPASRVERSIRSEERRVGKECRSGWEACQ